MGKERQEVSASEAQKLRTEIEANKFSYHDYIKLKEYKEIPTNVPGVQMSYKIVRSEKLNPMSNTYHTLDVVMNIQWLGDVGQIISQNISTISKYAATEYTEIQITYGAKDGPARKTIIIDLAEKGSTKDNTPGGNKATFPLGGFVHVWSLAVYQ